MVYDPRKAADRWKQAMSSAGEKYKEGVRNVKVAPTALAAQASDKYLQGISEAVNSGRWQRSLNNVSLQSWQQSAETKGAPRLSSGATAAYEDVVAYHQKAAPFIANLQQQVNGMPTNTFEERIAKMVAWANGMHQFENV